MKKTWKVLTGAVLIASLLAGCGASGAAKSTTAGARGETPPAGLPPADNETVFTHDILFLKYPLPP